MKRSPKFKDQNRKVPSPPSVPLPLNHCSMCGHRFKSNSHFDVLCNFCWADNEMKPYVSRMGLRGFTMVN